jgi:hypothetical protein
MRVQGDRREMLCTHRHNEISDLRACALHDPSEARPSNVRPGRA